MEHEALLKRIDDLQCRCEKANIINSTGFLTPAEQGAAAAYCKRLPGCRCLFSGGLPDCERRAAFFLPDWMEAEDFEAGEYVQAVILETFCGEPGHRDYLGTCWVWGSAGNGWGTTGFSASWPGSSFCPR